MITYVTGDATDPQGDGNKLIVHCCNDVGGWGAGFVLALSARWSGPEAEFRKTASYGSRNRLGSVRYVDVEDDISVANLYGQHETRRTQARPVKYDALYDGLTSVAHWARTHGATVHMPRIGCGLAGGEWSIVEKIIEATCHDVDVTVYDLP